MSRGNLSWLLIVPALLLAGMLFSYSAPPPDQDYQLVRTVVDVLAEVDKNYYRSLSPEEKKALVENMIRGGLHTLDDYSVYFNETDLERFDDENVGEFGGIGVFMAPDNTGPHLVVGSPMPNTPAYDAGIAPGDIILKIDGQSTENLGYAKARNLIKGKPGTQVVFTMLRGGRKEPEDITLIRAKIEQHAVFGFERDPADPAKWKYFPNATDKIALIRLETFSEKTTAELKVALEKVIAEGAKGLILDLRGNGGGLLNEACSVSDLFLPGGEIVSTKNRNGHDRNFAAKDDKSVLENAAAFPMVVLIDRGSASASEIVAAALQDNGRAVLIGERSFGKGSVQKVFHLPPDEKRAVKLTAEMWMTPKGNNITRKGVDWEANDKGEWGVLPNPGQDVKLTLEDYRKLKLLRKKLDVIPGKPGVAPPPLVEKKPDESLPADYKDPAIEKGLAYLRGVIKGN